MEDEEHLEGIGASESMSKDADISNNKISDEEQMRRNCALPFGSISTTTTGPSGVLEYNTQGTNNFQQGGSVGTYQGDATYFGEFFFADQTYLSMSNLYNQGGYTGLIMEQIRNSQEDNIKTKAPQVQQMQYGPYTKLVLGDMRTQDEDDLDSTFNNWEEEKDSNIEYEQQHMVDDHDDDGTGTNGINWQLDLFSNLQVEKVHCSRIASTYMSIENDNEPSVHEVTTSTNSTAQTSVDQNEENQLLTEEEIEAFIRNEQIAASEGNNASIDSKYTPQVGMGFENRDDAHHFFSFYAFLAGFEVVITNVVRTTSRKRNNEITKVTMKCHRYGKAAKEKSDEQQEEDIMADSAKNRGQKRNTNVQVKTDCRVVMVVKEENNIWRIKRLDLDHNHELSPNSRNQMFSGHKYMTDMEKGIIRTLNDNNIPTRKMISILSYLRGGLTALPYKEKDVSNFRTKINREITGNDMMQTLEFFRKKKAEDPTFFYRFNLDEEKKVKNMFWTDGSSIRNYAEYGDCVSFDTTYMTNKYNLPFAPFVGVTGHGHNCLFACAFISDETTDTFKWAFQTFLEAMGGTQPATIITDQDKAMRGAIQQVFTNTVHRNCFYHIKSKCYSKNTNFFVKNKGLPEEFEDIVNNSLTVEEFEHLWKKMIEDYNLQNNKYFSKMWENRDRFIPVYFKNDFFPFLQSTGRSEGTNSRFKDNVGPTYSVISFLREYQRIVESVNIMEEIQDHASKQKRPKELMFGYKIERQAQEFYNKNIFRRFNVQLKATTRLSYSQTDTPMTYEVYHKKNQVQEIHRHRRYLVVADLTEGREQFDCICGKFNKDGILCSHILKIMVENDMEEIPDRYIINRWRKKERKLTIPAQQETHGTHAILRHNIISRKSAVLNSAAAQRQSTMEYLAQEYDRLQIDINRMIAEESYGAQNDHQETREEPCLTMEDTNLILTELQDPNRVKNKGRPPLPKRLKTIVEELREKMKKAEKKKNKKKPTEAASPPGKAKKKMKRGVTTESNTI